ncbi:MAG TPA: DEAD/DEAH box helicase [Anaerolineae bacterium]|nr:DEAD/DEAH box helicase [Anaerolineae bacterium]
MLNPITYSEKVVSDFLRYQITTYPFADEELYAQMRYLLNLEETRNTPLLKGPYISLSRPFKQGAALKQLVSENIFHPHIPKIAGHTHLYGHQEDAVRAIHQKQHTLVSTGTGSGKTESFLYPIISHCLHQRDNNQTVGITAVIVYPMNALAEDQLSRLRGLLAGTGVTFGMYVGKTPESRSGVSGQILPPNSSAADYKAAIAKARQERRGEAVYPPEEHITRQDMRAKPPQILLTNVKQLELLLTRSKDTSLFADARLDFLVFDEAHTFSGAGGAETACLIRRLRTFCGRQADETICIATSATIVDPEKGTESGRDFATRFFGIDRHQVALVGESYEPDQWADSRAVSPAFSGDVGQQLQTVLEALELEIPTTQLQACLQTIWPNLALTSNWQEELYQLLASNELVYQMADILKEPKAVNDFIDALSERVDRLVTEEEALLWLALGAAARQANRPFLRPVVHAFVRGVNGAVVTFPDNQERPKLWLSAYDAVINGHDEYRFPVLSCNTCAQHYFTHSVADFRFTDQVPEGGDLVEDRQVWHALAEPVGGKRFVFVDRLVTDDNEDEEDESSAITRNAMPMYICRFCGALHPTKVIHCDACSRQNSLEQAFVIRQKDGKEGLLSSCIACGTVGRLWSGRFREPARPIRAVTVSDVHILAQNMLHRAERKRLIIFADNRQDAAFQSGWMQDHSRRFRLRALMYDQIRQGGLSIGDLAANLDDILEADDELSRSLVPEVWRVYRKESHGRRHREERKLFLHIQILRELTTGLKQRIGLEPWGRMRISYYGLNPESHFVQKWCRLFDCEPEVLVDGIASLLDIIRRNNNLHDHERGIFSRIWIEGDREIQRGYLPLMSGVPRGIKLTRDPDDNKSRVQQWLSSSNRDTLVRQAVKRWGGRGDDVDQFITALWEWLTGELKLFIPTTLRGFKNKPIRGTSGVYQIDTDKLLIMPHNGVYRCDVCRRVHLHRTPKNVCMAWRCQGYLVFEAENPDNYDLMVLDEQFAMLRPREHSGQVPNQEREWLEHTFKGDSNLVNALVATPTLELGVDIGALDAVLMRNVPPLPANYWQRAGRAGRRHRMAVNFTYARPASHDRAYFDAPLKLLLGTIYPPSINLRNELMIEKHVHATILTILNQLVQDPQLSKDERMQISHALDTTFPTYIHSYLFDSKSNVRSEPINTTILAMVIERHEARILAHVQQVFNSDQWPKADAAVVSVENLRTYIKETQVRLDEVIQRIWKRLQWALVQMDRLDESRHQKGTLDAAEDALRERCDRLVKRYKGIKNRRRSDAEGYDDTYTFGVLASEGFLPGYGLDTGSIRGTAQPPRTANDWRPSFDLPRPPGVALREYAPGNLIYANGNRFIPRFHHLEPDEPLQFQVDIANEAVAELGTANGNQQVSLSASELNAVPICDVDMPHQSHITDEEDYRFQLPVSVMGHERERHGGGHGYQWGAKDVLLRHNVHLRLVNVGPASSMANNKLGYPVCLICGQSRSPFASDKELDSFNESHYKRCGQSIEFVGFFANIIADAITIQNCTNRYEGYSVAEAIRMGAAHVLEMEQDDIQILLIAYPGQENVDVLLYDPMPGGSGLLEQMLSRWSEVIESAQRITTDCSNDCSTACIDCLHTFRNAYYHRYLDRHQAGDKLGDWGKTITFSHEIAPKLPTTADTSNEMPVNEAESKLLEMIQRAGLPTPTTQKELDLGVFGYTVPDFFYDEEAQNVYEGVCIYLDGLSKHIHGNLDNQRRDREIRDSLRNLEYEVIAIPYTDLTDREAMKEHLYMLGRLLLGRKKAKKIQEEDNWF